LHRCPNSVEDETSALPACFEWVEPEVRQRLQHEIKDAAVGLAAGHDVDSILFWRHVEVDVQYALWAVHLVQEHPAGIRRRIAGQDGVRGRELIELPEYLNLQLEPLRDRLDNQPRVVHRVSE